MKSTNVTLWAIAPLLLSGCGLGEWARNGGKVGPNYSRPDAPTASKWIDYSDPRVKPGAPDLGTWWGVFRDPALDLLMADAYRQNLSLRVAGERIAEARARRGIAVGNMFPQLQEAAGSFTANKASTEAVNPFPEQWFQNWNAGFNVSWELDFWGRFRRSIEAADADLEASVASFDDVLVTLLADVGANYIQYRTFQERIVVAKRNIEFQEKSYQLAKDKFDAGASTERDLQQARQVLEQTRALVPQLEAGARTANNALCVLLGLPPSDMAGRLGMTQRIPFAPPELANTLGIAVAERTYKAYRDLLNSDRWMRLANFGAHPQRLLWASTGSKDPNAPDTLYIGALASPFTINTMPEATLKAFADHGTLGGVLSAGGGTGETVIGQFERLGVTMGALAAQLQTDGAASFVKSWDEMMGVVAAKAQALD